MRRAKVKYGVLQEAPLKKMEDRVRSMAFLSGDRANEKNGLVRNSIENYLSC
jgi:hypothetical protein